MFNIEKESDHEGTRTLNLPIRSRTPYPLGHAASHENEYNLLFALGRKLKQLSFEYSYSLRDMNNIIRQDFG